MVRQPSSEGLLSRYDPKAITTPSVGEHLPRSTRLSILLRFLPRVGIQLLSLVVNLVLGRLSYHWGPSEQKEVRDAKAAELSGGAGSLGKCSETVRRSA